MRIDVKIAGPLFDKKIDESVKQALVHEVLQKIEKRVKRGGKGLGAKRNIITTDMAFGTSAAGAIFGIRAHTLEVNTTKRRPRTKGTAWVRKNVAIARSMAPRVLRKAVRRITGDLQ